MAGYDRSLRELTGYRLRRASSSALSQMKHIFAAFGLRRTTYSTLALIVENPGLRQSQLAETLEIERPNLVQIIDELENAGLARRKQAKDDRRAYAMQSTAKGRALYQKARAAVQAFDASLVEGLTDQQQQSLHAALRIIEMNAKRREANDEFQIS